MKQLILIIITCCNPQFKEADFLGTWEPVSETDMESGEVYLKGDEVDKIILEFRKDSLEIYGDDVYAWQIKGDSIWINGMGSFFIEELTANKLIIKSEWITDILIEYKRIK